MRPLIEELKSFDETMSRVDVVLTESRNVADYIAAMRTQYYKFKSEMFSLSADDERLVEAIASPSSWCASPGGVRQRVCYG